MNTRRGLAAVVVVCALSVVGCETSSGGGATPTGAPPSTSDSTRAAPALTLTRARTFNLASVNPCALLTDTQRAQLGAVLTPNPSGSSDSPTCNFVSRTGASYAVFLELASNATDTVGAVVKKVSNTVSIDGFDVPLISVKGQGCSAFVNTGDSEYLSVQANGTGRVPDAELCQLVQPATQMVLANLTALQP